MLAACGEEYTESVPGFDGVSHLDQKEHMVRDHVLQISPRHIPCRTTCARTGSWRSTRHDQDSVCQAHCSHAAQVPLLRIDGLNLVQSQAIVRYLARKHKLYGADDKQAAECVVAHGRAC